MSAANDHQQPQTVTGRRQLLALSWSRIDHSPFRNASFVDFSRRMRRGVAGPALMARCAQIDTPERSPFRLCRSVSFGNRLKLPFIPETNADLQDSARGLQLSLLSATIRRETSTPAGGCSHVTKSGLEGSGLGRTGREWFHSGPGRWAAP
jgi:hypothetical protein